MGWWAYGVISEQQTVAVAAARKDVRGQIVAYAAAFGSWEEDTAAGSLTSPYTTPLAQKLRQKKSVIDAIEDAHQQVLDSTRRKQRPLLSTSMNGPIYLYRQPASRRKVVLAVSVDDPGPPFNKRNGPPNDVDAIVSALIDTGFDRRDVTIFHNPDRNAIETEIQRISRGLREPAVSSVELDSHPLQLLTHVSIAREPDQPDPPSDTLFVFFFRGTAFKSASRSS